MHIVLLEPEIPQNAGNIARTCAATGARLHLVRPFGFEINDKHLKRAGLDYWQYLDITYYDSQEEFFEKNKDYRYPYAKLCDMTTRKDEFGYNNGIELGVDIDIFPLDAWDDDLKKAKQEVKCIRKNMVCLGLTKLKKPDSVNPIKRFVKGIVMIFCKMIGSEFFIKNILKASCKEEQQGTNYLGCKAWCVYGERGIIPASAFADTIDIEFEGEFFPAPKDYDTYLTCLYGDYLPEPPKEKQKTHHSFKAYRL